jgi:hypothetical protein
MPSVRSLTIAFVLANSAAAFMNPSNVLGARTHVAPQTSTFGARTYVAPQTSKTALFISTGMGTEFNSGTHGSDAATIKTKTGIIFP